MGASVRAKQSYCSRSTLGEPDAVVCWPAVDRHEVVLVGEFLHVSIDGARRKIDSGTGFEIADLSWVVARERFENGASATAGIGTGRVSPTLRCEAACSPPWGVSCPTHPVSR